LFSPEALAQSTQIVAIGDSNTAGFGVARYEAFPARLEALLRSAGYDVQVWNAAIPGDTFGNISARLDRYVPNGIQIVIVQAGYNDVLRRTHPNTIVAYLESIISRLRARRIAVVLCGFFYPDWDAVGEALTHNYGAVFVDGGSCYDSRYRGSDGLHMTSSGHQVVAARLFPIIERLLTRAPAPLITSTTSFAPSPRLTSTRIRASGFPADSQLANRRKALHRHLARPLEKEKVKTIAAAPSTKGGASAAVESRSDRKR
jgi:acyl-CoA thioesterase-1